MLIKCFSLSFLSPPPFWLGQISAAQKGSCPSQMSDIHTLQVTGTLVPSIMFASFLNLAPKLLWVAHSSHSLFHSSLGILSFVASSTDAPPMPPNAAPPHPVWCESPLCPELGLGIGHHGVLWPLPKESPFPCPASQLGLGQWGTREERMTVSPNTSVPVGEDLRLWPYRAGTGWPVGSVGLLDRQR